MLLAIIWIVLFLIWAVSGWWVYSEAGRAYHVHHSWLLVVLLGILGYLAFHGFGALR